MEIKQMLSGILSDRYKKTIAEATTQELYGALLELVEESRKARKGKEDKKKLYYISAEFLIGKLLSNNLINLGIYDEIKAILADEGKSISEVEEAEPEPSLGNGGLGRLAACFLDSIATLGLSGDGVGLNYHLGLFKQKFENNLQTEEPNPWISEPSWLKRTDVSYKIELGDFSVISRMYDIDVFGYNNRTNKLHLFDLESVDEELVQDGIDFDKSDINKNLTLFLYPDDSDEAGRLLRVYQQYFMVSSAARLIIDESINRGSKLSDLYDYAVIQINDTHPSMIIPELIRILCERGIGIDEAIEAVSRTCAYTNHTILAEALEKWPLEYIKKVAPKLIPIIEILDNRVRRKFNNDKLNIIDHDERVHMAHMDIHYSFSINGVASLHTDILRYNELEPFYSVYPDKFNNKTNGITFRRWLIHANPELSRFITSLIGDRWMSDASELEKLEKFLSDDAVLNTLLEIKMNNKRALCEKLKRADGKELQPNFIFDIQAKRLHEYKRQQLNCLYIIDLIFKIREGELPKAPIAAIFAAKAAKAYTIAKDIIHLILCLEKIIESDSRVREHLRVIMIENYNVTNAEALIPACDISEQISLASKEASGTGNMKFMLNGAVTLGTEDGANVEIHTLVGDENIYIFGDDSKTVVDRYKSGEYNSKKYYDENKRLKRAVDFITSSEMMRVGNPESLSRLKNELINKDWFMTFPDFDDYVRVRDRAIEDWCDRKKWAKKMLVNIARAGYFSSDRTIVEYNRDIWHLKR